MLAIAIGIIVMLFAIATGIRVQKKFREKVAAFNGHIIIHNYDTNRSDVSLKPISLDTRFLSEFNTVYGIKHIQGVANKGGVIRTETDFEGVNLKGVGADYNWEYFKDFLIEGALPNVSDRKENNELLISEFMANRLKFQLNDKIDVHFPKKDLNVLPNRRSFKIVGIYNSRFQDFDKTIMTRRYSSYSAYE